MVCFFVVDIFTGGGESVCVLILHVSNPAKMSQFSVTIA